MSLLVPQQIVLAGIVPVYNTAKAEGDGDEFVNSGQMVIHVKNSHADSPRTVTIDTFMPCNYGMDTEHDVAVVVEGIDPGPNEVVIGPFPKSRFNDAEGKIQITYSDAAADLTIAVVDLP